MAFFLYLGLYTWNIRTGVFDSLAAATGLDFAAWVVIPGVWAEQTIRERADRYVFLQGVAEENLELKERMKALTLELAALREEAHEVERLRSLMSFPVPERWEGVGGRVLFHRLGPHATLETMTVDQGFGAGVEINTPVVSHTGVVGRVLKRGRFASTILMLTDPNSKIAVLGQTSRTVGILVGQGAGNYLQLLYVPHNVPIVKGEILVTSGQSGIFPKGLPVAEVVRVEKAVRTTRNQLLERDDEAYRNTCSDLIDFVGSLQLKEDPLFQTIWARPLVDLANIEEVLMLMRVAPPELVGPPWPPDESGETENDG